MECEPPSPELIAEGDQRISNVIREVLNERFPAHAPHMVTGWHVCVPIMSNDGGEYMWAASQEGTNSWTILGMLEYAKTQLTGFINKTIAEED